MSAVTSAAEKTEASRAALEEQLRNTESTLRERDAQLAAALREGEASRAAAGEVGALRARVEELEAELAQA